ncbi:MAG TPA: hypothetical protein VNR86_07535 [Sphingomicrobium sp.]|nr:hypothetical protein [Sphingomicrobium sp.]
MSLHYPHLAVSIVPPDRAKNASIQLARNDPRTTQDERAETSAGRMRVDARPGSTASQGTQVRGYWRESAPVVGGLVVFLITAWLIWAAFATAASALIEAA